MRNKVSKIIMTVLFVFCMALSIFAVSATAADSYSTSKVDDCERVVKSYTAQKANKYLSGSHSYPTLEGYLFSGWYTEEACDIDCALAGKEASGTVYALFVPEHVLGVKAQVAGNLIDGSVTNDSTASLRFVTTVDSLLYKQVGFEVSYVDSNGVTHKATNVSNKVYKQLYVAGSNEDVWQVTPEGTFCGLSTYFRACTITGIPSSYYQTGFTARPFWVTLDGDKVYGAEVTKVIMDGCNREEVWVSSEDSNRNDAYNYGSYNYPYETLDYAIAHVTDGGVVRVKDSLTVAGSEVWTAHGKSVTITGNEKASNAAVETLTFEASVIDVYDSVTFTGLDMTFVDEAIVYAWGNTLEIASDVTGIDNESGKAITVYGGGRTALTGDTELILCAGTYQNIYGGGRNVSVTGDCTVKFNGRAMSIYGGSKGAPVTGDTYVTMSGGYVQQIFGGCESANVQGNTNVRVEGGEVKRRIYGGCDNASTQSSGGYLWNTTLALAWNEIGYQVHGNTNVSIAGEAKLLFDYSETLKGTLIDKTVKMDNSLIATSRYQTAFDNEYGTLIFNDNLYSTLGNKVGFSCNYEVTSGAPNSSYHYLVQASVDAGGNGEVYSAGDCLHIVPGPDKAATVRLTSKTGDIVFYTTEASDYPLPESSSTTTNIYVTFGTNVQTDEQKTFINETAEARIGLSYYKTVADAMSAAEKSEGAKVASLNDNIKLVNVELKSSGRGTVITDKSNYLVGDTVVVTATPNDRYSCSNLTVKSAKGTQVSLNKAIASGGGTCSFVATEEDYTIEATFVLSVLDATGDSWNPDLDLDDLHVNEYYTAEDYLSNPSLFVPVWTNEWKPPAELLDFEKKWESFFVPNGRLISIAHRGDNDIHYPENSIEGIMSSIAAGVDVVEVDVRTTKDGVHVLMHDETLTRTTNVTALRQSGVPGLPDSDIVSDWTFEQLRQLRLVYESTNGKVVTNYVIPTYEDVVMVCANKVFVYMDIKSATFDWEQDAYPVVKKYNAYRSVWLPHTYIYSYTTEKLINTLATIEKDSGYRALFLCATSADTVEARVQLISEYDLPLILRASDYDTSFDETYAGYFGEYRVHVNAFSPYNNLTAWKELYGKGYNILQVDDYMTLVQYIAEQL